MWARCAPLTGSRFTHRLSSSRLAVELERALLGECGRMRLHQPRERRRTPDRAAADRPMTRSSYSPCTACRGSSGGRPRRPGRGCGWNDASSPEQAGIAELGFVEAGRRTRSGSALRRCAAWRFAAQERGQCRGPLSSVAAIAGEFHMRRSPVRVIRLARRSPRPCCSGSRRRCRPRRNIRCSTSSRT